MRTLKLDKNNNLDIAGEIGVLSGTDALAQDIKTMITLQVKEYAYNTTKGVDWIAFLQQGDTQKLLSEIEQQIYSDSRVASCTIETVTEDGTLIFNITTNEGETVNVASN